MSKEYSFLDLFGGIGGFRLGLERAGAKPVGWVEWDKYARASYTEMYDIDGEWTAKDITEVSEKDLKPLKGKVDIITGGFPCQAFSLAGHRKGFEDTRGTLFFDIARFAKELEPKAIIIENVKGLVNHDKGNTLDTIVKVLNDLGYIIDFEIINSKYFGVPQSRERIFIIAVREDVQGIEEWDTVGSSIITKGKRRIAAYPNTKSFNFDFPKGIEGKLTLTDVLDTDIEEKYYMTKDRRDQLSSMVPTKPEGIQQIKYWSTRKRKNPSAYRVYDIKGLSPTLSTMGGGGREPFILEKDDRIRKLTPKECFRLQAYPDELFHKAQAVNSNSQLYKQAGNSVTVNVVEAISNNLIKLLNKGRTN